MSKNNEKMSKFRHFQTFPDKEELIQTVTETK